MTYFSFDCESIGLHGETFAVGICVWEVASGGVIHSQQYYCACPTPNAEGTCGGRAWVAEHVLPALPMGPEGVYWNCDTPREVRDEFWKIYERYCGVGLDAFVCVDCPYPVETNFLRQCIEDDPTRADLAPYPLLDTASALWAKGKDPTATYQRTEFETPAHNPMNDARQSLRRLLEAGEVLPCDFTDEAI